MLKKSFRGGERNSLEPLMRLRAATRGTISIHPKSITDLRRGAETMQQQGSPKIDFREIFRVVRFSTFATWVIPGSSQTKARESALQERMRPAHVASQRWRAAMEYYVGLDVSLKQTRSAWWTRQDQWCERAWSI